MTQLALSRRRIVATAIQVGAAAFLTAFLAKHGHATPDDAAKLLRSLAKGEPKEGRITITAPPIAENGNVVPVGIEVQSPMSPTNYVKELHVVADGNPNPGVASFRLTPASGKAEVQMRIRLSQTQKVIAVAEMSDGSLFTGASEIKVTIGGCGG